VGKSVRSLEGLGSVGDEWEGKLGKNWRNNEDREAGGLRGLLRLTKTMLTVTKEVGD